MDIKDLKSAWDTYSAQEMTKHRLGPESIHELLKKRTNTLVERINRNIVIGVVLLGVYILYSLFDFFYFSVFYSNTVFGKPVEYPKWLEPIDVFSSVLILTTYLFFVLSYWRVKRSFSPDTQLKDFLTGISDTLITYRRMFYLAVIILLINISLSFFAGIYEGIEINSTDFPGGVDSLSMTRMLGIIGIGLTILIPIVLLIFFLLRWGFNRLYGRYVIKINETLLELDESGDQEI